MVRPENATETPFQQLQQPQMPPQQQQPSSFHPLMDYPLHQIPHPHAHDVLCGRGTFFIIIHLAATSCAARFCSLACD